jgi:hypothetical protein
VNLGGEARAHGCAAASRGRVGGVRRRQVAHGRARAGGRLGADIRILRGQPAAALAQRLGLGGDDGDV